MRSSAIDTVCVSNTLRVDTLETNDPALLNECDAGCTVSAPLRDACAHPRSSTTAAKLILIVCLCHIPPMPDSWSGGTKDKQHATVLRHQRKTREQAHALNRSQVQIG
jgi:hypothetical protein